MPNYSDLPKGAQVVSAPGYSDLPPGAQVVNAPQGGDAPQRRVQTRGPQGQVISPSGPNSAPPDSRNGFQKTIDTLSSPSMQAEPNEGIGHHIARAGSNFGAGVIGGVTAPIAHPLKTLQGIGGTVLDAATLGQLPEKYGGGYLKHMGEELGAGLAEHPEETIETGLGNLTGTALLGVGAAKAIPKIGDMIPSRARAGATLQGIRTQAANVPVPTSRVGPELSRWQELTDAGGKTAKPMTKLIPRVTQNMVPTATTRPLLFPEARDIYSNISDLSHQHPLQTLMGRGLKPTMLRQAGQIRSAFNSDLTDAAGSIGRGEDFTNAMKEYANASKLRKAAIGGGLVLGEEGLRRSGLLGRVAKGVIP